jgi:hypothetical protein
VTSSLRSNTKGSSEPTAKATQDLLKRQCGLPLQDIKLSFIYGSVNKHH